MLTPVEPEVVFMTPDHLRRMAHNVFPYRPYRIVGQKGTLIDTHTRKAHQRVRTVERYTILPTVKEVLASTLPTVVICSQRSCHEIALQISEAVKSGDTLQSCITKHLATYPLALSNVTLDEVRLIIWRHSTWPFIPRLRRKPLSVPHPP